MLSRTRNALQPLAATCLLMLSACTGDDALTDNGGGQQDKTPIELSAAVAGESPAALTRGTNGSAGGPARLTRAVVTTDGTTETVFSTTATTSLYMVMKSGNEGDTEHKYARTMGTVAANADAVTFSTDYQRYWEDSYSRASQLAVYAACVPGLQTAFPIGDAQTYTANTWSTTTINTNIAWPLNSTSVVNQNTGNFTTTQDLCFSNNVSKYTVNSSETDNRIKFLDASKQFDRTKHMTFYRALTKVTFVIKKGLGFKVDGDDADSFIFSEANKNIVMTGFNSTGTFNIESGEFAATSATTTIDALYIRSNNPTCAQDAVAYELDGLLVPGTNLNDETADAIVFEIDHNKYHLTKKQLMTAIGAQNTNRGDGFPALETVTEGESPSQVTKKLMRAGVHYTFTMTVGKKKVDAITARVVEWETVTADETTPSNARIVVSLLNSGVQVTDNDPNIDLFRSENVDNSATINDNYTSFAWTTGYAPAGNPTINKAKLQETSTDGLYEAKEADTPANAWYWPNNKTFYHFRMVSPKTETGTWEIKNDNDSKGDYITLVGAESYKDVCWGAPFKNGLSKVTYKADTGFDNTQTPTGDDSQDNHQIFKAIGPTESTINIVMFHMMSDVTIQLTTPVSGDADYNDRVDLNGSTLSLSNIYNSGLVRMGNGKVETTGTVSANPAIGGTVSLDATDSKYKWHYGFVPQDLSDVVLTIKTGDNNLYQVTMKNMVAAAANVGNKLIANPYNKDANEKYIINYWYPNYKYTYTFRLTKTDISLITATLADWETVNAEEQGVQIK